MDADWDLHAVVRGCATVNTTPIPNATATDNPFPISPSLPFHNKENSFDDFPGLFYDDQNDPFLGLHEIYQVFCVDPPPEPTNAAAATPVAQVFQPNDQIAQMQPLRQMNMPRQENVQLRNTNLPSPLSFPDMNSQPVRQRRRKNQQTKMIREMTQEQLEADSWAWRKYGQKPIKGSPYPRNYYRCCTSKGCAARKQVERSLNDQEIFVVSYSGEHTHPRPIYRSSLTGSTRNRFGPTNGFGSTKGQNKMNITTTNNNDNYHNTLLLPMGSHSSPGSGSSFSPDTPTMEGEATKKNDDVEMVENVGDDDDDENVIMVNDLMTNDDEDIFKLGFKDSDESSGEDLFSGGALMSPPWTPTDYIAAATMFDGEGGD